MGKEEEHPQAATLVSITSEPSSSRNSRNNGETGVFWWCYCCGCGNKVYRHFGVKCVLVLLLSGALFLSAMFWLPPFLRSQDPEDLDLDSRFRGHAIVASFHLQKPSFFLQDNIPQLEDDIFGEINVASIKVVVLSIDLVPGTNITKVVFAIDPDGKNTEIPPTALSLIHASFEPFVTRQIPLRLTTSLFGEPFSFEVLKFQGGITIIPQQSAYLLQKVQILFNFTLNFSIEEIQNNFYDLTSQLKSGLHLTSYENLYIKLSNERGSTVAPPTTVQSSVLLAVGNTPSMPRLKQLAQTIKGSPSGNLGLNNVIFGKVKQVSLSSILEHSLSGSDGSAPSASPSAAPQPHAYHPHHHHHHHHSHHHHFHDEHLPPVIAPAPAYHRGHAHEAPSPAHRKSFHAPGRSFEAKPPSPGCHSGYKGRWGGNTRKRYYAPAVPPVLAPHHVAVPPSLHRRPPPHVQHSVPVSSPLPHVVYAHAEPPTKSKADGKTPQSLPLISPSPYSSSAGLFPSAGWTLALFLALVLHL